MRNLLFSFLILAATGCACPDYVGDNGEFSFRSCADPSAPLMRGSAFALELSPEQDAAGLQWAVDGTAIGITEQEAGVSLGADAVGTATVSVTADDGRSDSLEFKVREAASARWEDPWWSATLDLLESDATEAIVGEPLPSHPGDTLALYEGGGTTLTVGVYDADDTELQYSAGAITYSGAAAEADGTQTVIAGPGTARVSTADGVELSAIEVVSVGPDALNAEALSVAAYAPERPESDDQEYVAYLRAVVRDDAGQAVHGAPVVWTLVGAGSVSTWDAEDGEDDPRRDIATYRFLGSEQEGASTCITAELDGVDPVSVWLSPDGNSVHADGTCGGQAACAGCNATGSESASVLALLALFALGRRRYSD